MEDAIILERIQKRALRYVFNDFDSNNNGHQDNLQDEENDDQPSPDDDRAEAEANPANPAAPMY